MKLTEEQINTLDLLIEHQPVYNLTLNWNDEGIYYDIRLLNFDLYAITGKWITSYYFDSEDWSYINYYLFSSKETAELGAKELIIEIENKYKEWGLEVIDLYNKLKGGDLSLLNKLNDVYHFGYDYFNAGGNHSEYRYKWLNKEICDEIDLISDYDIEDDIEEIKKILNLETTPL